VVDGRLVASCLTICGFAAGWFGRACVAPPIAPDDDRTENDVSSASESTTTLRGAVFDAIYATGEWGRDATGAGTSGAGSTEQSTTLYRTFLAQFLKRMHIHSVVDAGCGDWEFSQMIDWTGIDYKGFDIVPMVIARDEQKYAQPNIQFFVADIVEADLPPADLLIAKHVLQHLPNADVQAFLTRQLHKYKHVLLVDGVMEHSLSADNHDINTGQYRPLDLTRPPFNLQGTKVLTYWDGGMHQVLHLAQ
jgi:SAM-dependent methyltransferase